MRVTEPISEGAETFHDALATSKYLPKNLFRVLAGREIQLNCSQTIKFR
jgi:hypothetical protein